MDNLTQKKLDQIVKKEVLALTDTDVAFLKARKSYLTEEQLETYKTVFSKEPVEVVKPRLERSRGYRAMQRELSALGHHVVGVPKEELERMLDTIHGPQK